MLQVDNTSLFIINFLLNYCGVHKDCTLCRKDVSACKDLEIKVLKGIKELADNPTRLDSSEMNLILELIDYCGIGKACTMCKWKRDCLTLEVAIERELERVNESN